MAHKLNEVRVEKDELLSRGYRADELVGKTFEIEEVTFVNGDQNEYMVCKIKGEGLEEGRNFTTGAHNIVARVRAAISQGLLPLEVTITKIGNAFDVE